MHDLKFGIEIEFFGRRNDTIRRLLESNGITVEFQSPDQNANAWILKHDGSVHHEGNEIVSPILYGDDGLQEVKKVLDLMVSKDCKVDCSCGIHVHHDISDFSALNVLHLCRFFYNNQSVFNLLMTDERLSRSGYCKPLTSEEVLYLSRCNTIRQMLSIMPTRYKALNIQSYIKHGTVEFRQHYGCLDSEKVLNWIELTYRCVCYAKEHEVNMEISTTSNIKNKLFNFRKDLNLFDTPLSKFINRQIINLNKAV